jgi:membrane protease YdiL (CAAX protease family)
VSLPEPEPESPPHSRREALVLLAVSVALALGAQRVPEGGEGTFLKAIHPTLAVLAWIGPTYFVLDRRRRDPLVALGVAVRPRHPWEALATLVFLPLYGAGYAFLIARSGHTLDLHLFDPRAAAWAFAHGLLFAALPEETFFRGAFQPSLAPERPWASIVVTSVIFALLHVLFRGGPEQLLVFFPSLVFGYLRWRTGSIVPGIVFHALCNALDESLRRSLI